MADSEKAQTLHTWKEIANFLGASVRASQGWERTAGLPVKRTPGTHGQVAADVEELRRWMTARARAAPWWRSVTARIVGSWMVRIALLIILAYDLIEHHGMLRGSKVGNVAVSGRVVSALSVQNEEIWRKEFPAPLDARAYAGGPMGPNQRWIIEDLNQDGMQELVFVEAPAASGSPHRLHVLNSTGQIQWSFPRQPQSGPELTTMLRIIALRGGAWGILVHFCRLPNHEGTFTLLSADGEVLTQYQHDGHLEQLAVSGDVVLLGGECNQQKTAEVHQFRLLTPGGSYRLHPEQQLHFPRSCINRLLGRSNRVSGLAAMKDGYLVSVAELIDEMPYEVHHELKSDLTAKRCWTSDAFRRLHRRLEIDKWLRHALTDDEERQLCTGSREGA